MKHLAAFTLVLLSLGANAQLTITDSLSASSLAQLLEGLNVSITNVEVNCPPVSMGHFTGPSELEIDEGLVLTTGWASMVADTVGAVANVFMDTPGDGALDTLLWMDGVAEETFNACVLEFDCIPLGDTLLFNFSFGSEEYHEWVGNEWNDIFAIFLSGPGFPTPTNVAALPDGTPVPINNVNLGVNDLYFYDNEANDGQYVAYDGFTTNLTAFAVVSPGEAYHFKVAIADVDDYAVDSGVFLEAFSFRSTEFSTGIAQNEPAMQLVRNGDQITALLPADATAELMVMNAAGSTVQRARIIGDRTTIDIAGLSKGLYTVVAQGMPGVAPARFVVDR